MRTRLSGCFLLGFAIVGLFATLSGCAHLPWARDAGITGPATVTGVVTSDRGAVIADAAVTLSGPSVMRHARTDIGGRFRFDRVPFGRYLLAASATGFKGAKERITVDKEETLRADLKLKM